MSSQDEAERCSSTSNIEFRPKVLLRSIFGAPVIDECAEPRAQSPTRHKLQRALPSGNLGHARCVGHFTFFIFGRSAASA